jgi:hypothetical protein
VKPVRPRPQLSFLIESLLLEREKVGGNRYCRSPLRWDISLKLQTYWVSTFASSNPQKFVRRPMIDALLWQQAELAPSLQIDADSCKDRVRQGRLLDVLNIGAKRYHISLMSVLGQMVSSLAKSTANVQFIRTR